MTHRLGSVPNRRLAAGAHTAAGTLAGLLFSTTVGLFAFTESTAATWWWESFRVALAAVVVLAALAVLNPQPTAEGLTGAGGP